MGWNQRPLTKMQILKLNDEGDDNTPPPTCLQRVLGVEQPASVKRVQPMVQTVTVPLDVQLTTAFGRLTPIRPENAGNSIFGPNSGPSSRVNVTSATIAALKAGLALHFRRQVTELAREHRRAVAEIPRLPKTVVDGRLTHLAPPSEKKEEEEEEEEKHVYVETDTYGTSSRRTAARAVLSHACLLNDSYECLLPPPSHIICPLSLALALSLSLSSCLNFEITPPPRRRCTGHIIGDCFGVCTQRNWCLASCRVTTRIFKRLFCCGEIKFWWQENKACLKECFCVLCSSRTTDEKEEEEEEEEKDEVKGHGEYDIEIKDALDARYDAAIKELVRRIESHSN